MKARTTIATRGCFKGLLVEDTDGFTNAVEAWKAKDYKRLAWATRSLVELKIWTKYVLASKDNALALNRKYDVDGSNLWALSETGSQYGRRSATLRTDLSDTGFGNDNRDSAAPTIGSASPATRLSGGSRGFRG